ncbi:MAG: HAD family phosphatase [Solobacterium sp.]|nr:HAD family phosphatase [Solobacterium sp.]
MIRNIIFDMGNVLKYFSPPKLIGRYDHCEADNALLLREVFHEKEWVALDAGAISEEDAVASIQKRLPKHLHETARKLIFDWWKEDFDNVEGMEELIQDLHNNGYHIYLLSNASIRQAEYFDRLPGFQCFEGRITSAEEHLLKPQREIYELLLGRYDLKAEECVFIDDSPSNAFAAQQCGIKAIVFHDDMALLKERLASSGVQICAG